jgi:hypothetical protein
MNEMILADEALKEAAEKERQTIVASIPIEKHSEVLGSMAYLNYLLGMRQEEMVQILYAAGLTDDLSGPNYAGLSEAWKRANKIKAARTGAIS